MSVNYITDEVKALIGAESPPIEASHAVESSEVRRFHHATMDPAPRYWDEGWAMKSRYERVVAPPAFPVHAFRRSPDAPDPLDAMGDPDFDGRNRRCARLPPLEIPRCGCQRLRLRVLRYARVGERIFCTSRLKDVYQRDGKSGRWYRPIEDPTRTSGEPLIKTTNTIILRERTRR
jgi:hypothetical protein